MGNTIHANQWNGLRITRSHDVFIVNNAITQNGTQSGSTGGRYGVSREGSTSPQPEGIDLLNNLICGNRLGEINGPALDSTDSGNLTPQGTEGVGVSASPGCEIPANVFADLNGPDTLPNTADDSFALASGSPAIDRGMDPRTLGLNVLFNAIFEADFFIEGARPVDGDQNGTAEFDMGAFEFVPPNRAPVANAGPDQTVNEGTLVTPDGSASFDPDGNPITFQWTQIVGPSVTLSNPNTATPSFTAPQVDADTILTFQLTVSDGFLSSVDSVNITVKDVPAAPVNNPPVLEPIGNQTVAVGTTLTFTVRATDPDNDPLTFSVTPLPLPANASFNLQTRIFTFSPSLSQVGSFQLTFSVSDGRGGIGSETITITVPAPDPAGETAISGRVLDANAFELGQTVPVVGATVSILGTGESAQSDVNGNFTITGIPSGSQVFDINTATAQLAPDGSPYAGFREEISLIANVNNVVDRPFFLPRIDRASLTTVDPNATTVVTNPNLGVTLTVPAHTAKNPDGTDFTEQLSISFVPRNLAPAALPDFLDPGLLITIQPVGVTFSTPVPITFPNTDNLTPGSEVDIWSLNAEKGVFEVVGTGRVSADGTKIETISGGIRAADWHAVMPPSGNTDTDVDESEGLVQDPSKQCLQNVGSNVALNNGCLGVNFSLPSHRSLGLSRSLRFIYKTNRANPQPVLPFNSTISVRAAVPPSISYKLSVAGIDQGVETFVNTSGLSENIDETIRNAASFDASSFETGVYPYTIRLTSNYPQSRISSDIRDRVLVVNEQNSPFGAGWGIEGLGRLHFSADGSVVVTDGNGSATVFTQPTLGLVSWWRGEGNADDAIGLNNGTLQNSATFTVGKVGQAFSFDGVDDLVNGSSTSGFPLGSSARTITAWIKSKPVLGDRNIFHYGVSNGNLPPTNFHLFLTPGGQAAVGNGFGFGVAIGNSSLDDDTFHFLAGVYEGPSTDVARIYVDGVEQGSAVITTPGTLQGTWAIGRFIGGGTSFNGLIDEVQIYNRALSASEIQTLFNSTSPLNLVAAGDFTTPAGDFSVLTKNTDDTFTRTLKDGTKINFDAQGQQASVVDRNGNTTSYSYDASNRLVSITDPAGLATSFTYTGNLLSSVTDPAGRVTTFQHDAQGNLTKVTFPDGSFKSFGYDSKHLMTMETNEGGFVVQREYDSVGRLVKATLPDGTVRSATSSQTVGFADPSTGVGTITNPAPVVRPDSALSSFTDGAGNTQTVKVGRFGAPLRITDPLGQTTLIERRGGNDGVLRGGASFASGRVGQAFSFDGADDHVETAEQPLDPDKGTVEFWFRADTSNRFMNLFYVGNDDGFTEGGGGNVQEFSIEIRGDNGQLGWSWQGGVFDQLGFNTIIGIGSGVTVVPGQFFHVALTYDRSSVARLYVNGILRGTASFAGKTLNTNLWPNFALFGANNRLKTGQGTVTQRFQGPMDEVRVYDRPLSAQEIQAIFTAGNVGNRATSPAGLVSWWQAEGDATDAVGSLGLPTKITRPNGAVVTMSYDSKGNLLTSTDPVGATTTFTYEPSFNQVKSSRDPKGNTTTINYDAKGNPIEITDALGNKTQMTYDARGLLTSVTSGVLTPQQNTTSFTYDARGNLVSTTDPLGNVTTLAYDSAGNVIRSTDAVGRVTEFTHDTMNRLVSVTDPDLKVTNYAYDAKGNLVSVADAKGQTTTFSYDSRDRLSSSTNPLGFAETFAYDPNGNLISTTNRNGETIDFAYDVLNRLIQKTRPATSIEIGPQVSTSFSYDSVGNLTSVVDSDSTVNMAYDLANRLVSTTASTPLVAPLTTAFTYDLNGNRLTMTDPQSGVTNYVYDALNRLTSFTNPSAQTTSFSYDALGRRTSMAHANGVVTTYNYDAASQLLGLVHQLGATTINSFNYIYDQVGNRTSKADNNGTANYTYDTLNRLVQATNPLPSNPLESFTYDAVGNRVDSNQNGASLFNAANQLTEDGSFTYQYDANGNQTRKTDKATGAFTVFEYDAENKLVRVVLPGGDVAIYRYDGLGRRVEKEVSQAGVTTPTRYIFDNEDILLELDGSNSIVARYTHGPGIDEPLILEKTGASFFYHADGLGSITEITNASGTVVQAYTYSSFGKIESTLDPSFVQPYTFTAREFDPETGLYFYRSRTLDPNTGRFNQEDPVKFLSGINFYSYVANNPIGFQDPSGQFLIGAAVGAGVGAISGVTGALAQQGTWVDVAVAGTIGLVAGGLVGAADPSEGVVTTMLIMGGIGAGSNVLGQTITSAYNKGHPFADFSIGSLVGSTIGSAIGGGMSQFVSRGLATLGASEFVSKLGGELIAMAPSALGGAIGNALADPATGRLPPPQAVNVCLPRR